MRGLAAARRCAATRARGARVARRRRWCRGGAALHRIPWRKDPAPHRRDAEVAIVDDGLERKTLGTGVRWQTHGLVHQGRIHHCGIASRVASPL
jgi:hypothetical protein